MKKQIRTLSTVMLGAMLLASPLYGCGSASTNNETQVSDTGDSKQDTETNGSADTNKTTETDSSQQAEITGSFNENSSDSSAPLPELQKTTFVEMNEALRGYLWSEFMSLSQSDSITCDEAFKVNLTDAEKIRASVLASKSDGRIDEVFQDDSGDEFFRSSVSESEVEENCKNLFGTDAKWDILQTSEQCMFYDAVKYTDSTGTYPIIYESNIETETDMKFQDYRITEESGGYAGEVDMFWGYWGEIDYNPERKNHTVVYRLIPDESSKYGFIISSIELKPYTESASAESPAGSNTFSNGQSGTANNSQQNDPFYGIWCTASKDENNARKIADKLTAAGLDGRVYLSSDWSNLNSDPWYVVTAGVFSSESDAKSALASVKSAGYSDAYVKYSGDYVGR